MATRRVGLKRCKNLHAGEGCRTMLLYGQNRQKMARKYDLRMGTHAYNNYRQPHSIGYGIRVVRWPWIPICLRGARDSTNLTMTNTYYIS
jgi:hypothetical protein